MCIMSLKVAAQLGLRRSDLLDCHMRVSASNNTAMEILGTAFLTF